MVVSGSRRTPCSRSSSRRGCCWPSASSPRCWKRPAAPQPSGDLRRGIELLAAWDDRVAATSVGALVFQRFWDTYRTKVKQPYAVPWIRRGLPRPPTGLGDPAAAVLMLEEACAGCARRSARSLPRGATCTVTGSATSNLPGEGAAGLYGAYRVQQFDNAPDGKRVVGGLMAGRVGGVR